MTVSPQTGALWTAAEIAVATGGRIEGAPFEVHGVSIDSRSIEPGDLFVALAGARDGHDFADAALARGAAALLASRDVSGPSVRVDDTLKALEQLGEAARDRAGGCRRAAVTGSVGKTSVTQAIAAALALAGPSHSSVKSYNNHIGVPLTLARMPRGTERAVFEVGMNHAEEVHPLSRMVRPHVAVVTTVGPAHIENFPDGQIGVARAKAEIFEGLEPGGVAVLNADNAWFDLLRDAALARGAEVRSFGRGEDCTAQLLSFEAYQGAATVHARLRGHPLDIHLAQTGAHWGPNALATVLAAEALGAPVDCALRALAGFEALAGRGAETRLRLVVGAITLIDESYNANPISMRAALDTLGARAVGGRRIVVLTDMLELGAESSREHAALAEPILAAKVDQVFLAGPEMKALSDALPSAVRGGWRDTTAALAPIVVAALQNGDVVVIKGSNGSKAFLVVDSIKAAAVDGLGENR